VYVYTPLETLELNYLRCNCASGMHEKRERESVEDKIKRVIFFSRRKNSEKKRESLNEIDHLIRTTEECECNAYYICVRACVCVCVCVCVVCVCRYENELENLFCVRFGKTLVLQCKNTHIRFYILK